MFYYYEKAGKLLASERRDLPYLKAEPAPGTPICYLVEGDGIGQDVVDSRQQAGNWGPGAAHCVAPDEGVQGGLHEPLPQRGQEVHAVYRPLLLTHQVPAVAGEDAHQDKLDVHPLLAQDGVQGLDAHPGVHQVVHQDDGPVKGFDGAHLAGDGGVVGKCLDGALAEVRGVHPVGVDGLGDRVGHSLAPEQLTEGDAHIFPQLPGGGGLLGHLVELGDHPQ